MSAVERHSPAPVVGAEVCGVTALTLPDTLTRDEWLALAGPVFHAARASMWWVGDWIIEGEHRFGETYVPAAAVTGLARQTLKNAASVCRQLAPSRRRDDLTFQHHAEIVGGLPEPEWDRWLEECAAAGWTRDELRARIRAHMATDVPSRPGGGGTGRRPVPAARLVVPRDRAPAALTLLERADRVLARHLSPPEREVLDEWLSAMRAARDDRGS